ncbi:MAG: PAS domain S-box protein [Dehalococcoidia bacterium]|nr:PAS domain S-box protein [Dehalococcoidia bacterium]
MTRLLIADDNAQNLYLLETILKSQGYEVISAGNGAEALESALKHLPDIIVTDILMPVMDGFELCRRWRAHELLSQIPFIFYTATYTDLKDENFALSLGADRFVIKPQQPEMLVKIIREVLNKPRKVKQVSLKKSPEKETEELQQYNEVLFRKLEKKVKQLEDVITKQQKTEDELRESELKHRSLIAQSPDGIFIVDLNGNFLAVNRVICENLKYSEAELLSMGIWDIVPAEYVEQHKKRLAEIMTGKAPNEAAEYVVRGKDGELYVVEISSAPYYEGGKLAGFQGIARDITARKKTEDLLRASEEKYRSLVENINDVLYTLDNEGTITYVSPVVERLSKYKVSELIGKSFTSIILPEDLPGVVNSYNRLISGQMEPSEFRIADKDGRIIFVRTSSRPIYKDGEITGITALITDVTERRKLEKALSDEALRRRILIDQSIDGIVILDHNGKVYEVNKQFAAMLGYSMEEMRQLHVFDWEYQIPREKLIEMIRTVDEKGDHFETKHRRKDGSTFDVEISTNAAIIEDQKLIFCVTRDITERKQAEQDLIKSYQKVRKTLNDAINTMSKIVEMRDPYTAGHQHRVAELSIAIARELGYRGDHLENLYMAALIHDIGKIYVPSDILSKPGRLSNIEFNLVKTHAQGSYEILKNMEFPTSIAQSVLQHHERLDGSGYPGGLQGDAICREARLIAVADVVEAMSSHRPYRPALGPDKALEEITANKGKLYDADVVEACLSVFRKQNFKFE